MKYKAGQFIESYETLYYVWGVKDNKYAVSHCNKFGEQLAGVTSVDKSFFGPSAKVLKVAETVSGWCYVRRNSQNGSIYFGNPKVGVKPAKDKWVQDCIPGHVILDTVDITWNEKIYNGIFTLVEEVDKYV